ncbi:hypothetical protein Ssi03_12980 [Sphaerisporangium siamense]|uniref:Uncharacterized protein n=1 Tax=Sphaerisporangium siamense TaxID=795645 RepID=A0A7W7DCM6_9ACTN|nr:hypothetical protein [Sphaerisporangium siamense]MBB4702933.1 hypothetical protein [Sphaerisporangium siamense]GII83308.1 hypothetical protein Ssi03_12980 [Sphaerisporangium siamense]
MWSFAQRRGFTVITPLGAHRFEEPWACCEVCKPMVVKRQLHMLLQRAQRRLVHEELLNGPELRYQRAFLKKVFKTAFEAGLKPPVPLNDSKQEETADGE